VRDTRPAQVLRRLPARPWHGRAPSPGSRTNHLRPTGVTNRLTIAIDEELCLHEIVGISIAIQGDRLQGLNTPRPYGQQWRPERLDLEVNGYSVTTLTGLGQYTFNTTLELKYPDTKGGDKSHVGTNRVHPGQPQDHPSAHANCAAHGPAFTSPIL